MQQRILIILLVIISATGWIFVIFQQITSGSSYYPTINTSVSTVNNNTTSASWGDDQDISSTVSNKTIQYTSQRYQFSWSLNSEFSFIHFPPTAPAMYAARFDQPNLNQSLSRNRQTLVGFNIKPDNEITLEVWPNQDPQLTPASPVDDWSDVVGAHRRILEQSMVTINGNKVFRATEMDGEAGAYGYYYYFVTPMALIVIGTTDFSQVEIEKLLPTFNILSI